MSVQRRARLGAATVLAAALAAAGTASAAQGAPAATPAHHGGDAITLTGLTETVTQHELINALPGEIPTIGSDYSYVDTVQSASKADIGTTYGSCVGVSVLANGDLQGYCAERIVLNDGEIDTRGYVDLTGVLEKNMLFSISAYGVSGRYQGYHGIRDSVAIASPILWSSWINLYR